MLGKVISYGLPYGSTISFHLLQSKLRNLEALLVIIRFLKSAYHKDRKLMHMELGMLDTHTRTFCCDEQEHFLECLFFLQIISKLYPLEISMLPSLITYYKEFGVNLHLQSLKFLLYYLVA